MKTDQIALGNFQLLCHVATAYDYPDMGKLWVLIINEALYFGSKMTNTLLCQNQLQQHGIVIENCPRQFDQSSSHGIFIPSHKIHFPLSLNGIISGLITRQPTDAELEDFNNQFIFLVIKWCDTDMIPSQVKNYCVCLSYTSISMCIQFQSSFTVDIFHPGFNYILLITHTRRRADPSNHLD